MKMIYVYSVMTVLEDPAEIINYTPGDKLDESPYDDWTSEYDYEYMDDVGLLTEDKTSYIWNEDMETLEVCEVGFAVCECDDAGNIVSRGEFMMSEIEFDDIEIAKDYMRGVL